MRPLLKTVGLALVLAVLCTAARAGDHSLEYTLKGAASGDLFGNAVAGAGDVNADGYDDLIVGAMYTEQPYWRTGSAYVYSGKDGSLLYTFEGEDEQDELGTSVAGAGDVNGDGYDDVMVGAPNDSDNGQYAGAAYVYSGKDGKVLYSLYGTSYRDNFGRGLDGVGDLNADGFDDFAIGAPQQYENDGKVRVYSGKDGKILFTWTNTDSQKNKDVFGWSVAAAGDVNGDGTPDVIVGDPWSDYGKSEEGSAHVYSGKDGKSLYVVKGKYGRSSYGYSVDGVGDANGDGYDDFIVGAPREDANGTDSGRAYVYSGKTGTVLYTIEGGDDGNELGWSVAGVGDANGDGQGDFAVGEPGLGVSGKGEAGGVSVYSGRDGTRLLLAHGDTSRGLFGFSVAGGGEVNAVGRGSVIIGEPKSEISGVAKGKAWVWIGNGPSGTLTIGDAGLYTKESAVTLNLEYAGTWTITDVRFRNKSEGIWTAWETVGPTRAWTLPTGDGEKIVEMQLRASDGEESETIWDSVTLDTTAPAGTILIDQNAAWTASTQVPLDLTWTDALSGVAEMRLRNGGGAWGSWTALASKLSWTVPAGDGTKTVDVQFRDAVGNESTPVSDSIALDQTAPSGSIVIDGGAEFTGALTVSLAIAASDAGIGVTEMRLRDALGAWEPWEPYATTQSWGVPERDGAKSVEVQFRDGLGNESSSLSDAITLDQTPPSCTMFSVNQGQLYVVPTDTIEFGIQSVDAAGGSGVSSFRTSYDGGSTWSDWQALAEGYAIEPVTRPEVEGLLGASLVIRDGVGNVSAPATAEFYLVEKDLPELGSGGKLTSTLFSEIDVDALAVGMGAGDLLTVKLKVTDRKKRLDLAVDLVGPDSTRLVRDRYPSDAKGPMILKYAAPTTGTYLLVVRQALNGVAESNGYQIVAKVKSAKTMKKGKGRETVQEVVFDAVNGSTLKALLKASGITAGDVTLEGPDGPVVFPAKPGKNKLKIGPVVLTAGTGRYRFRLVAAAELTWKWSAKPPPKLKGSLIE